MYQQSEHPNPGRRKSNARDTKVLVGYLEGVLLGIQSNAPPGTSLFPFFFIFIVLFTLGARSAGSFSRLHIDGSCTLHASHRLIGPKTLHLTQGMHERPRSGIEDSWAPSRAR
jgi:hypothetical protein